VITLDDQQRTLCSYCFHATIGQKIPEGMCQRKWRIRRFGEISEPLSTLQLWNYLHLYIRQRPSYEVGLMTGESTCEWRLLNGQPHQVMIDLYAFLQSVPEQPQEQPQEKVQEKVQAKVPEKEQDTVSDTVFYTANTERMISQCDPSYRTLDQQREYEHEARRLLRAEIPEFAIVKLVESYGEGYLNLDKCESDIVNAAAQLKVALEQLVLVKEKRIKRHLDDLNISRIYKRACL
jgi:hypothetical protein